MNRFLRSTLTVAVAAAAVAVAVPALAGPPLLCHPYDIGTARSLPWSGVSSWWEGAPGYSVANVVADTEALLTPATPVIVRMETLRRAAIYASTDQAVAARLLQRLLARVEASRGGAGHADPLALLDAAYVAGAYREFTMMGHSPEFRNRIAGVRAALGTTAALPLIAQSVAARPDDPSLRFAAAMIAADSDRTAYETHAARARAGVSSDPLLARNIKHVS